MKFEFIVITGVFFNLLMIGIFPHQLLSPGLAEDILPTGSIGYDLSEQDLFNQKYSDATSDYLNDASNQDTLEESFSTEGGIIVNPLEAISSFFDGLLDSLNKAKMVLSFIVPFASLFFVLPGYIGLFFGGMYSAVFLVGVIRFIRGV